MFVNVVAASHGATLSQRDGLSSWAMQGTTNPNFLVRTRASLYLSSTLSSHVSQWQIKSTKKLKGPEKYSASCLLIETLVSLCSNYFLESQEWRNIWCPLWRYVFMHLYNICFTMKVCVIPFDTSMYFHSRKRLRGRMKRHLSFDTHVIKSNCVL